MGVGIANHWPGFVTAPLALLCMFVVIRSDRLICDRIL